MNAPACARRASLRKMLTAYEPADAAERAELRRMHALLEVDGDPLSRRHFEPGHFTASAFVVSSDLSRMLLILHGKLGFWLQPGGHIDAEDEDVIAAAKREVSEEVGIEAVDVVGGVFDVSIHTIPALRGEPGHEHFDVRLLLRCRDDRFTVGSDARAAKWVALNEVHREDTDPTVVRAAEKVTRLSR